MGEFLKAGGGVRCLSLPLGDGERAGTGSTPRATLRVDPTSSELFPRLPREDGPVTTVSAGEPNRVLVVDDERAITDLVAMALKYEGFSVQTAATAKQARHAVMDFRPDLMILDVGLPDDDGFTLVQRLITDGIKVPVIFLTARDATEEKVHGLTIGGDDYVTKPFSIEELVARIRVVLRRHNPDGGAASGKLVLHDLELDDETHEVFRGGAASRADAHRVPSAALPDDEQRPRALPHPDPRPCLGLRLRR